MKKTLTMPWRALAGIEFALIVGMILGYSIAPNASVLRKLDGEMSPAVIQKRSASGHTAHEEAKPRAPQQAEKPMSEWRRAYIAKHGQQPPVASK